MNWPFSIRFKCRLWTRHEEQLSECQNLSHFIYPKLRAAGIAKWELKCTSLKLSFGGALDKKKMDFLFWITNWLNFAQCQSSNRSNRSLMMMMRPKSKPKLVSKNEEQNLTKILPVPVWPEMSSPAQSFASDMKSPSGPLLPSPLPCRRLASSSCRRSSAAEKSSSSFLQQRQAMPRTEATVMRPTRKVKMEDRRKHHHFRSIKHSSSDKTGFSVGIDVSGVAIVVSVDIVTSIKNTFFVSKCSSRFCTASVNCR